MSLLGLFIPDRVASAVRASENERILPMQKTKGQLRAAKPKASGAARLKRSAKKRANIRKRK